MSIQELKEKLEKNQNARNAIETELQAEYDKIYNDSNVVKQMIRDVEDSRDYQFGYYGDIESWVSVDLSPFKGEIQYLSEYLSEYFVNVDEQNELLTMNLGNDNILINHEGDVFQEGKLIVDCSEYGTSEKKMNKLIEEHMEETGYFPGVFRTDYHGNVFLHNTREKE